MLHDLGLAVGHVLELVTAVHVAERPHPRCRRAAVLVDDDVAHRADVDAGQMGIDLIAVRQPAGGDQQRVALDGLLATGAGQVHADPAGGHVHAVHLRAEQQLEPLCGQLGVPHRDVAVLGTEQVMTTVDDRDLSNRVNERRGRARRR